MNTSHVINFELAKSTSDYMHRIGRTGRAEREGHSFVFSTKKELESLQNIEELISAIQTFVANQPAGESKSLSEFMMDVALLTDADEDKGADKNHVTLMTIHSSKGLEFQHVHLVGLEENLFPSQLALNSRTELEEERRLFYVAITRAKSNCTLSYSNSRFQWGNLITCEASRFIDEIDDKFLNFETPKRSAGKSLNNRGSSYNTAFTGGLNKSFTSKSLKPINKIESGSSIKGSSDIDVKVGYNVEHDRFGRGKIIKLDGIGSDKKAVIFFPNHGSKTVLLRFANLKILDL